MRSGETHASAGAGGESGLAAAAGASGWTWIEYATEYVRVYLTRWPDLFCDDVWASGLIVPRSPRAFGQVMKNARHAGWMEPNGSGRQSLHSHNSMRRVYRSLIYHSGGPWSSYPSWSGEDDDPSGDE